MKTAIKVVVVLVVLAGLGYGGWTYFRGHEAEEAKPRYRTAPVLRSDIVKTVEATGTVQPIKEVEVGTQVNGKIIQLFVDYNSVVTNGQLVALIDPQVYQASYDSQLAELHQDEATIAQNRANIAKCEAQLVLAEKTLVRKQTLVKREMAPVADLDSALEARDTAKASLDAAKATLRASQANLERAQASVRQAKANLDYCTIVSPVNGIVIDRSVDEGQTVVSSMNAVALVKIATDLKRIQVEATVPEADVGSIRVGQKVTFTADAYRRKFTGEVKQIRLASETTNNVVTYPIIIEADNPDQMLFPGMTANISVEVARAEGVPCVTSAALRFRPVDVTTDIRGRKVWVVGADGKPEAIKIEEGISDASFTQIVSPKDLEGREVIIGLEVPRKAPDGASGDTKNPFMPKPPQRNKNKGTAPEPRKP